LDLLIFKDYKFISKIINLILSRIKKVIESKNNNLMMKYLYIINLVLDEKLTRHHLLYIDNLIKDIEERDESYTKITY